MPDEEKNSGSKGMGSSLKKAESMIQLALAVPAGCFAGLLVGALLDRHFHTHWIVIAGMLLGSAGRFYSDLYIDEPQLEARERLSETPEASKPLEPTKWTSGLSDADLRNTMSAAMRLLAILAVLVMAAFWLKFGWQSGLLVVIGATISGARPVGVDAAHDRRQRSHGQRGGSQPHGDGSHGFLPAPGPYPRGPLC